MNSNFKKPNLNAPRYRKKTLGLLNKKTFKEFKDNRPIYSNIDDSKLKDIIKYYNRAMWEGVIKHRDGVELPDSLGYLFIGTCPPAKNININYSQSNEYGKVLRNKNWDTDGNIGKIFYTNWSTKYRFKNRELWSFVACRDFKRSVAKEYPKSWTKYIKMQSKMKVSHLYDPDAENTSKMLKNYDEFET